MTAERPADIALSAQRKDEASRRASLARQVSRYGVPLAIVATFVVFSVLRPDSFFTELTIKGILRDCVPLMITALGITVVLAMNDYDLSVGGLVSLCATVVIVLVSSEWVGMNWVLAIFVTIAFGGLLGLANGLLIAYLRLPSFILTIASGTVFAGLALQIVDSQSVYLGIPPSFVELGQWHVPRLLKPGVHRAGVLIAAHTSCVTPSMGATCTRSVAIRRPRGSLASESRG